MENECWIAFSFALLYSANDNAVGHAQSYDLILIANNTGV